MFFTFLSVQSQVKTHRTRVKLLSVNELPSPTTNEKVLVLDLVTNEIKFVRVSDLPISGGGDTSQWANYTGSWSNGDGVLVLGDINDDNNGTKITIDDDNEVIKTNVSFEAANYRAGSDTNNSTINTIGVVGQQTFTLPNSSGRPVMTINGNAPDNAGAITISTGGSSETTVFKVPADNFDWTNIPANYANTTIVIRHDFDLSSGTITLPSNVTLQFEGGEFTNGTINFNNTTIIAPSKQVLDVSLGTGAIINNYLDATWFGVVGDDSTNNTNRINSISTYLTNQGGGTVYFPNGTYQMADAFVRGNVSFVGQGWNTILKAASNPTNGILNIVNPDARIFNLQIDGNDVANIGVRLYNNNGQGSQLDHIRIRNCNTYSLEINDTNNVYVGQCMFNDKVYVNGGDSAHIVDNRFEGFTDTYALRIETTSPSQTASSANIVSNWFESTSIVGFATAIESNGNSISIVNNQFHLPYTGTVQAILVGSSSDFTNITSNNFQTVANNRVLTVNSGSNYTNVRNNRGLANTSNYLSNGDRVFLDLGDIRIFDSIDYRPINSDVTRMRIDVANERIQYGDNANNYIEKQGANLLIQSNSRTNIYSLGNNISLQAQGTNGTIFMNSPMRFRSLALASFPAATSYLRGVGIYDFTNHDMYINNSTAWVRQLNETDLSNVNTTFQTADNKTVTVTNGIITAVTDN